MTRTAALLFSIAFALNYVWEHLHSVLYTHYKSGPITDFILLHATFADAVFITLIALPFFYVDYLRTKPWLIIILGVALSIGIELWALQTGRWAYGALMPLVPGTGTGLTPTIQLGLLGFLSYLMVKKLEQRK